MTTHGKTQIDASTRVTASGSERRVTLAVTLRSAVFLGMISQYSCIPRKELYQLVWRDGFESTFGITEEELAQCDFAPPAHDAAIPKGDLKALTDLICGE